MCVFCIYNNLLVFYVLATMGHYGYNVTLRYIKSSILISVISSILVGIVMILFRHQLARMYSLTDIQYEIVEKFIVAKAIFFPFEAVSNLCYRYAIVKMKNKVMTITNSVYYTVLIGFDILVIYLHLEAHWLVIGTGITYFIVSILSLCITGVLKDEDKITLESIKILLKHCRYIVFERITGKIATFVFNICASHLGTEAYAVHGVAYGVTTTIEEMSYSITDYSNIMLHSINGIKNKFIRMKEIIRKNFLWFNGLVYLAGIIMVFPLKGDVNTQDAIMMSLLYLTDQITLYFYHIYEGCLLSMELSRCISRCGMIGILIRVPIAIMSVFWFGITGFALASTIDFGIRALYYRLCISRHMNFTNNQ